MKAPYQTLQSIRKSIMYAAAIFCIGAISCTKDLPEEPEDPTTEEPSEPENPEEPETPDTPGAIKLTAVISPLSATEGEPYQIGWKTSDKISVWTSDEVDSNVEMSLKSAEDGVFTGDITTDAETYTLYGIYPYSDIYTDINAVPISIAATANQTIDLGSVIAANKVLFGKGDITAADETHSMEFSSPLAYIDITVDGTGSYFSDGIIEKLTLKADVPFTGEMTYDLETGTLTPVNPDAGKELVISYGSNATMSSAHKTFVAVAPVADLAASNFSIVLNLTNGQQITFKSFDITSFEVSSQYTISLTDINKWLEDEAAEALGVDLVAANGGERANCYIVSHGGRYRFAVDRIGNNSNDKITGMQLQGITSADWLWSTGDKTLVENVVYGKSGNIFFYVYPNSNGNAIIAATNDTKEIVWSWHIWMTTDEDPLEPTHYTRNNAWLMSDRNLGATSNKEGDINSYGLYYQWGRKDPFPGANQLGSTEAGKEDTNFGNWTAKTVANAKFSNAQFLTRQNVTIGNDDIAFTIKNPMYNIHYNSKKAGNDAGENTWAYNLTLAEFKALWNSSTDKKNKTIYDPCPAGYCVPVSTDYAWRNVNKFTRETNMNIAGYIFNATDGADSNQGGRSYYPPTGYRDAGQLKNLGFTGLYWSAAFPAESNTPRCLALESTTTKNTTNFPARGLAIRCMKM